MSKTVLILDDETIITKTLSMLIRMSLKCNVLTFNDPQHALNSEELTNQKVDLVISDFMMPRMNGIEFLKNVKKISPDSITILLTGYADKENAIKSINEVGVYYYLEKPWNNNDLITIMRNALEKKEMRDDLKESHEEIKRSKSDLERLYELLRKDFQKEVDTLKSLIIAFANIIEAKDEYTDGHTRRVGNISKLMGKKIGFSPQNLEELEVAAIIHDIGKVGIPEQILNKPSKLTPEEFEIIKKHTIIGETICKPLNSLQGSLDFIRHHHEKLNGKGYPDGLRGDEISLGARIISVADIFDALYSDRPYREKLTFSNVKEIMTKEGEEGFIDINLVNLLFEMIENKELEDIFS